MPPFKPLDEAVEEIVDAIRDAIQLAVGVGLPLDGVASVVRGDRERPMPPLPSIWVVPDSAANDHSTHGLAELWKMPVTLAALVKSDNPDIGSRLCVKLAARAREQVLKDRRLGLAYVRDTVSTRFSPNARSSTSTRTGEMNRNLFWSDAVITVTFSVLEGGP